ncbi:MAG: carbon-nitrogen hydrolase family protein [Alphaproteobacteria bacterium]
MTNPLKIACIQMNSGNDMAANIKDFEQMLAEAAGQGAVLAATPENTFLMDSLNSEGTAPNNPKYRQQEHPGIKAALQATKKNGIWLLLGGVAVLPENDDGTNKTYNRSLLIDPEGSIAAGYNKIHLFDVDVGDGQAYVESARYLAGDKPVVAKLGDVTLGMSICYDVRFPYLYRQMAQQGAQLLAVPAAFIEYTGKAHWHVLLRARAIENGCFVIAPAQCGAHPGDRRTFGHSLIINPWGEVLADGCSEPGVVMADIDMDEVKKVRAKIPSLMHCRNNIMGDYSI